MVAFTAKVKETDLWIASGQDLSQEAVDSIMKHRRGLEDYIREHPEFANSLEPLPYDDLAPPVASTMLAAAKLAGTGPMAAVAGALAQAVGRDLAEVAGPVMVENGGDLYLDMDSEITVGLWASDSPISGRLGLKLIPQEMPLSLSTSSGTVGHSLSLGKADAATVRAKDAALADAVATALGNRVRTAHDLSPALDWAAGVDGVEGALIVLGSKLAAWGKMELVHLQAGNADAQGKAARL